MRILGAIWIGVGFIVGTCVWIVTAVLFFSRGDTALGVIALVAPPADLVLPFLISVPLGIAAIGSFAVMYVGAGVRREFPKSAGQTYGASRPR